MAVIVGGGVARLANPDNPDVPGAIAGGTSHLIDQIKIAHAAGIDLAAAVRLASHNPARTLGFSDVGALVPGKRANISVTDSALNTKAVFKNGSPI